MSSYVNAQLIPLQLDNLHKRTDMAILLIATRTSLEAFGDPVFHHSDPRVLNFIEATTGSTIEDLALRLEAYTIAGVEGI